MTRNGMAWLAVFCALSACAQQRSAVMEPQPLSTIDSFSYDAYDRLTRAYVDNRGRVDYSGLRSEIDALRSFVEQLAAVSPDNRPDLFPTEDEQKRYYLTAYNALVLYFAAEAYPDKHALWSRLGYFKNKSIVLGGLRLTLDHLEHNIIRKRFLDPRIHFYLNCGALSCPPLKAGAIARDATESELEEAARRFVNDPANVRFDHQNRTLYLSKIFDWYEDDFLGFLRSKRGNTHPHISGYTLLYLQGDAAESLARTPAEEIRVRYFDYDKGLNEQ